MNNELKSVVIVGGGTAGWMAAASLARFLQNKEATVTLIESTAIGTVGVGEATLPSIVNFNHNIGINELDFIRATQATFKLGIEFENWSSLGKSFFHPFSDYGVNLKGIDFHHYFYRLQKSGVVMDLRDYSIACSLAKHGRFAQPLENPPSPLADYSYAYHFDAILYAKLLREHAIKQGVHCIDQSINAVNLRSDDGFIESVQLQNGAVVQGDLFIDCTGFKGLLIEETLKTGYEDWSHWLLCDSAIAAQSENETEIRPYTRTTALDAGWMWRIPLQHRMGNGVVYSSRFIDSDQATTTLLNKINGEPITQPRKFSFQAGRRKQVWNKNCYALGLASGFLEPLESTSISLIQTGITHILSFFPDKSFNPHMIAEINRRHLHEMEHIRDFIILHYKLSSRTDTEFWRYCQAMDVPDTLKHKIELFKSCGHILLHQPEAFQQSSWLTMYHGFNVTPERYDERANQVSLDELNSHFEKMKSILTSAGQQATTHTEFIRTHCG